MAKLIWLIFILIPADLVLATNLRLDTISLQEGTVLTSFLSYLPPEHNPNSIEELLRDNPSLPWRTMQSASFGITSVQHWVKLTIENPKPEPSTVVLENRFAYTDTWLGLHYVDGKRIRQWDIGDQRPFGNRDFSSRNLAVRLNLQPGENLILMRMQAEGGLQIPLSIWDTSSYNQHERYESTALAMLGSFQLVMILYSFFLFLSFRDKTYLAYISYIFANLHHLSYYYGISQEMMFQLTGLPWIDDRLPIYAVEIIVLTAGAFSNLFLNLRKTAPRVYRWHRIIYVSSVINIVLTSLDLRLLGTVVCMVNASALIATLISTGTYLICKGYKPAIYYVLAWSAYLLGSGIAISGVSGVLEPSAMTFWAQPFGTACEAVLLALALGQKINYIRSQDADRIRSLNTKLMEKDAARTAFFHNTSHELRTPLNGMIGYLELAIKGRYGDLPQKAGEQLQKALALSASLKTQVNTILDLARSKSGGLELHVQNFDLNDLVTETSYLTESLTLKSERITHEIICNWPETERQQFRGDFDKILTIIRNLVGNAAKFCAPDRDNHIRIELGLKDQNLFIAVSDNGIGIEEKEQSKIFEEFYQVQGHSNRRYEGTGLGLSMVGEIVRMLNGKIKLESQPDQGSRFEISLPESDVESLVIDRQSPSQVTPLPVMASTSATATAEDKAESQAGSENADALQHAAKAIASIIKTESSARIHVIDDNPYNCEIVKDILEDSGFQVSTTTDPRCALAQIQDQKPDLILLDLMMPEVSGEDLLKALKESEELNHIPVMILTARASQDDRIHVLNMGADDYLAKPIVSDEIVLRVSNLLGRLMLSQVINEKRFIEYSIRAAQLIQRPIPEDIIQQLPLSFLQYQNTADIAGGDFVMIHRRPSGERMYFLIADVTGHGVVSGLLTLTAMAILRSNLDALDRCDPPPALGEDIQKIVEHLNESIFDVACQLQRGLTLAGIAIDLRDGSCAYVSAGHQPILLVNDQSYKQKLLPSPMLGIKRQEHFPVQTFNLQKGDRILLYTDGLWDYSSHREQLNFRTFGQLLQSSLSMDEAHQKIQLSIKNGKLATCSDDCTYLIVGWENDQQLLYRSA